MKCYTKIPYWIYFVSINCFTIFFVVILLKYLLANTMSLNDIVRFIYSPPPNRRENKYSYEILRIIALLIYLFNKH